jgi:glutathione S-transferase/maleylpyruvate isomerase
MLTVYSIPVSLYCAKLRILLRAKGVEWEEIPPPGGYGSNEYKTVVPSGNLPALRHGDLLLCDSEAIAEYVNELHPEPPLLSPEPTARARERDRGRFHDTRFEPSLRTVFPHLPGRPPPPAGFLEAQSAAINARLDQLAGLLALSPGAGEVLSLGDCGYPITFGWIDAIGPRMGLKIALPEPVAAYRARIETHPPVAAELGSYLPTLAAFLDG